ncbi:MAG: hypothetical protein ACE37H_09540 [Phycisphaeraceae bacterium]
MRRWLLTAGLAIGSIYTLGCEKQAEQKPVEIVDDSPVLGVWYLQAAGDRPVAIDSTIRFEFKPHGEALYHHATAGPEQADTYELSYNLAGKIISIDGESEDPGVPRITGQIELADDAKTLRISTHTDEDWLLTRDKVPAGDIGQARKSPQQHSKADPRLTRVQRLAYLCNDYAATHGKTPDHALDLIADGLISPEQLLPSGSAKDLPARYTRMSDAERRRWLDANSAFVFYFDYAGTGQASSVVVTTLPDNGKSKVVIGMANGAVYLKSAKEAAKLLRFQTGKLPERWPESAWSREATAGLEPLSD